jgi:hypothetical protein
MYVHTIFYIGLIYATVVWNSITSTDVNELDRIQQKFAALSFNSLFPIFHYRYAYALKQLKLHTLHKRRYHLDALFLIRVYRGSKFRPSLLETLRLRVPARHIR